MGFFGENHGAKIPGHKTLKHLLHLIPNLDHHKEEAITAALDAAHVFDAGGIRQEEFHKVMRQMEHEGVLSHGDRLKVEREFFE